MTNARTETPEEPRSPGEVRKHTIAEKMAIAEELRDLQDALAPIRAANKAKRAAGKVEIRIKTR